MRKIAHKRRNYHQAKLNKLINESKWEEEIYIDNVINLSDKEIPPESIKALKYGFSFHINNKLNALDVGKPLINLEFFLI